MAVVAAVAAAAASREQTAQAALRDRDRTAAAAATGQHIIVDGHASMPRISAADTCVFVCVSARDRVWCRFCAWIQRNH